MRWSTAFEWCTGQSYPNSKTARRQVIPSWWTRQAQDGEQQQLSNMLSYSSFHRQDIHQHQKQQIGVTWRDYLGAVKSVTSKIILKNHKTKQKFAISMSIRAYKIPILRCHVVKSMHSFAWKVYFILSWKQLHLYCLFLIQMLIKALHFFANPTERMKLNKPQRYLLSNLHVQLVQSFKVSKSLADIGTHLRSENLRNKFPKSLVKVTTSVKILNGVIFLHISF